MTQWLITLSQAAVGVVEGQAAEAVGKANEGLTALPLLTKGLLTTLLGLLGVFLVLAIYFITIKLMQRVKPKEDGQ